MRITRALLRGMEKAEHPRAIRALSRALELSTGLNAKEIVASFSASNYNRDWYAENGYRGLSNFGGVSSFSGQSISLDSALESAAFLAGVKIISEDEGSLPFLLYEKSADGLSVQRATNHPLYSVLHDLWNPEVSAGEGVEALTAHALMTGNGYAGIVRVDNKVRALYPWQPDQVRVSFDDRGSIRYEHMEKREWKPYQRTDVLHLKGFTLTGTYGDSLLQRARHVIGLTLSTQEYPARWFAQGSMMDVVLERPREAPKLGADGIRLLKEGWVNWHRGLGKNSFDPAVLQEGTTAKLLTPKPSETQLIEQRKFQVLEVCRLLRLTPHKLAEMERSAYASIEAENIAYIQLTLSPWVRRWKQAVHRCLLTPEEQIAGRLYAEQNVEALQRGDFKTQMDGFRAGLDKGVYTINEVRRWFNLNPVANGDENRVQLNTVAVADAAQALIEAAQGGGAKQIRAVERPAAKIIRDDKGRVCAVQYGDAAPTSWRVTAGGVTTMSIDRDASGRIAGVNRHGA